MPGMVSLKNELTDETLSFLSPESPISRELDFWETFSFDNMDRDQHSTSRNPRNTGKPQRSRSTSTANTTGSHLQMQSTTGGPNLQDAALLAQFAAATAGGNLNQAYSNLISPNSYPSMGPTPGFYGNFLHHNALQPQLPQQLPPLSSLDFPWHGVPSHQPQASGSHFDPRQSTSGMMSSHPFLDTQYSSVGPNSTEPHRDNKKGKGGEGRNASSPEVEMTEAEHIAIADEKRRRNTAASARFRIKKKHKTIGLERSVSDLTGRAEELEREAADLRRENGWLKEIVMLKGTQFAASNIAHRDALSQAAALATRGYGSSAGAGPSGGGEYDEESESESSDDDDDDDDKDYKQKGKGKQAPTKKK